MNKIIVDTNIFIYALDWNSKYHEQSVKLITSDKYDLYTTSKNISEYLAVSTKMNIDKTKILDFLEDINRNVSLLYSTPRSSKIFIQLFEKYFPAGNRVHDIEIASIALAGKIKSIATFNTKDFHQIDEIKLLKL